MSIGGQVFLKGKPPRPVKIKMTEAACRAKHPRGAYHKEVVANPDGSLRNVFVYVKEGLPERRYPPPVEPVRLDQQGCTYVPHVFGVQVGQPLEIINSDSVLHNLHALPKKSRGFNAGMPPRPQPWSITRSFSAPEVMVKIKCDVHSWMICYAGVLAHPFYAVTGDQGAFYLKGLPGGTYLIEAWHERYGVQSKHVTVTAGETTTLRFTYNAS